VSHFAFRVLKRFGVFAVLLALSARADEKQILFGDLHVHTTYSFDAVLLSLPTFGGDGAHPPDDACDFARYCSRLDFFSINDHAESVTENRWAKTKEAIRHCNARFADPDHADLMAFTGWEWTQMGDTAETHYGHKNVMFLGTEENELPARPISALGKENQVSGLKKFLAGSLQIFKPLRNMWGYADLFSLMGQLGTMNDCPENTDVHNMPAKCRDTALTPDVLFRKLDQWGFDYLVIPHGVTWGVHSPPGSSLDAQLTPALYRPDRQRLLEVYSGHGNGEVFRNFPEPNETCSPPTKNYYPCCWRAGEIMRSRCGNLPTDECNRRVDEAKRLALVNGEDPYSVFPDARIEEWLDCDQCRNCFKPAFLYRPKNSAQYGLALSDFDHRDVSGRPLRYDWGFIASSDNHSARAGTGYKQFARKYMTEASGLHSERLERLIQEKPEDEQMPHEKEKRGALVELLDVERGSSFYYLGGLVAVHATEKSRQAVWQSLQRKEVYATSGPKILLWFDLVNDRSGRVPMGGTTEISRNPRFHVKAQGSFVQKPGCPDDSIRELGRKKIERLCRGECYNPSDTRLPIESVEIVRIRPQSYRGEKVAPLIEDPWRRVPCPHGKDVCEFEFEDPDFKKQARDTVYYVRALQSATPAVNGGNYRAQFENGVVQSIRPCYGSTRKTAATDDCLSPVQERAWSSPIHVNWKKSVPASAR
jgi:hypothetical protein